LNNHFFNPEYDYFTYNGKVTAKFETYDKKSDKIKLSYELLGKKFQDKENLENFFVANIIKAKKRICRAGQLFEGDDDPNEVYIRWQGRTQSLEYNLINEIRNIMEKIPGDSHENGKVFNSLFECKKGKHPEIIKAYLRKDLSLESFVLLDLCFDIVAKLEYALKDDCNWFGIKHKVTKYTPFIQRLGVNVHHVYATLNDTIRSVVR
jgi:hypothetical protein